MRLIILMAALCVASGCLESPDASSPPPSIRESSPIAETAPEEPVEEPIEAPPQLTAGSYVFSGEIRDYMNSLRNASDFNIAWVVDSSGNISLTEETPGCEKTTAITYDDTHQLPFEQGSRIVTKLLYGEATSSYSDCRGYFDFYRQEANGSTNNHTTSTIFFNDPNTSTFFEIEVRFEDDGSGGFWMITRNSADDFDVFGYHFERVK